MTDRLYDCDQHKLHLRDRPVQPRATRRIVSTAGAAAWLPHAKRRDTHVPSG